MAKGQYTFKDFLREQGETSLYEDDPVVTSSVLREVKMGLSAMGVLVVLVVVLFHESSGEKEPVRKTAEGAAVKLTVRSAAPENQQVPEQRTLVASVGEAAGRHSESTVTGVRGQRTQPPTPAIEEPRPGSSASRPDNTGPGGSSRHTAVYKVSAGDTLSGISEKLYGSSRFWKKLAAFNDIADPARLRVGMELKIPPLDVLEKVNAGTVGSGERVHPPPVEIKSLEEVKPRRIPCI